MNTESFKESSIGSHPSIGTRLERVCEAFEADWRTSLQNSGDRPRIEIHIEGIAPEERWAFLRELILTDHQYRELAGEVVDTGEYEQRFPEFAEFIPPLFRKTPSLTRIRDYRLLEVIGQGGMGTVYKAQHLRLGKTRAIKVLARHLLDNQEAVERFRLEVENSGRLEHANIVQALDAGEENDVHFLVMEFVEGWNLARLVEVGDRLPVDAACELIRQASIGLQHAHDHFLVHRDIKPSNLMLNHNGLIKILDLGLARFIAERQPTSRLTMSRGPMGTCDYMAPEQWSDASSVDIRADIYSLGCTLYYVLTGQPPFGGENYKSLVQKQLGHQHAPVPSVVDARPDVPAALQDVVERMMAKAPEDRYAEPAEVIEDIEPFAGSDSVASFLSSLPEAEIGRDRPTDAHISSAVSDTQRAARRRAARRRSARPWYRHPALLVMTALAFAAVAALPMVHLLRPNLASEQLVRDVALLPGLNGHWWFDEMPWYTPAARAAVANALRTQDVQFILEDEPNGYLDSDVVRVQEWLMQVLDRSRDSLPARHSILVDELRKISSEKLDDVALEKRLRASYEKFVQGCQAASHDGSAEDLYTRAILEHKLAELSHDDAMAAKALNSYDAAVAEFSQSADPRFTLQRLCQTDSARLCFSVRSDYPSASDRFEKALAGDAPLLFKVETLAVHGHASRKAGEYDDKKFLDAKKLLDESRISDDHPLRAHVRERYAWSLMDRWNVEKASSEFEVARDIRRLNSRKNRLASIYVFHNIHGVAMTYRYRGDADAARYEYKKLAGEIERELNTAQSEEDRIGQQQYLHDLRERLSNTRERWADCVLYEGAASNPTPEDLDLAATLYELATEGADDSSARIAHACKRCIVLALKGDVAQAEQELEEVSGQGIIGEGSKRVDILRSLAKSVVTFKEAEDAAAGHTVLRQFLVQQGELNPFDQFRRETLELQLLCAELLLRCELETPEIRDDAQKDLYYLADDLLRTFMVRLDGHDAVEDVLPFLRRFYDLAICVAGETNGRAAGLILTSRGPNHGGNSAAVRVLFHLHDRDGLVALAAPTGDSAAFKLDGLGREHVKSAGNGGAPAKGAALPDALRDLIAQYQADGLEIECLWSDAQCWPESQKRMALTEEDFPFTDLIGTATIR